MRETATDTNTGRTGEEEGMRDGTEDSQAKTKEKKKRRIERQDGGGAGEGDGNQDNKRVKEINREKWAV